MADPAQILQRIRGYGANVTLNGDRLDIVNSAKLPAAAIAYVRQHGQALADFLDREAQIEERSAIMEHEGGIPRDVADHCARAMIAGLPAGLSELDRAHYIGAIGRIVDEVFHPAGEEARAA